MVACLALPPHIEQSVNVDQHPHRQLHCLNTLSLQLNKLRLGVGPERDADILAVTHDGRHKLLALTALLQAREAGPRRGVAKSIAKLAVAWMIASGARPTNSQ
jgi:hypothetical protein